MKVKKPKSKHLTSSQIEYLAEHYPDTPNDKLAEDTGLSINTIRTRAIRHGWHKSKEFISRINHERAMRCKNFQHFNTPEAYKKRVATMSRLYQLEKTRIEWGLEKKTKIRVRVEPTAKRFQRNRLKRLGYIIDEKTLTAYYTPLTHRAIRIERIPRGTTKGTIHAYYDFKPYDVR